MHVRFALAGSLAAVSAIACFAAIGAGGCSFGNTDAPPGQPDVVFIDDTAEVSVVTPEVTVFVDGKDVPANLACLGKPRDAGVIHEAGGGDTATPADTASADSDTEAATDGDVEADVDATPDVASETSSDVGAPADSGPPALGTLVEEQLDLIAFGTGGADKLPNQLIDVYYSNSFSGPPDLSGVASDSTGVVRVVLPYGMRVGYHVRKNDVLSDYWELDDLHVPVPPATRTYWQGITTAKFQDLSLAVTGDKNYVQPPGTGIIAARVVDCDHRYLRNAVIELRDMSGGPPGVPVAFDKCSSGKPCLVYLSDAELPAQSATWTSRSGLVALINVPTTKPMRLVAIGYNADGSSREVGHRDLEPKEGVIVTHFVEPNNK